MEGYRAYQQLVARVEAFGRRIRQRYPDQITCHAGCDGCCYQQFTIFPVEAYHLAQTISTLTPDARQHLRQHLQRQRDVWRVVGQSQPCVLLDGGRCALYDGRPLICRMHGYPLHSTMIERPDGGQRDCCPLNFSDLPLADIDPNVIYNLDLVNQTLTAINHRFIHEHGLSDKRVTFEQAVWQALQASPAARPSFCLLQGEGQGEDERGARL